MSKVRDFISRYLSNQRFNYISVDFEPQSKQVDGINFYLSRDNKSMIPTGDFWMGRSGDDLFLKPLHGFGIYTKDKIDLSNSEDFLCSFDKGSRWQNPSKDTFQDDKYLDLHEKYNIPYWVLITYSRYHPEVLYPIDIFNLYLYWGYRYDNPDLIFVSIRKLERLFENSEHLEKDVSEYLKKNIIEPTIEYYKKLVKNIFESGILNDIISIIRELSDPSTEVFEDLDLHELFEKVYQDE